MRALFSMTWSSITAQSPSGKTRRVSGGIFVAGPAGGHAHPRGRGWILPAALSAAVLLAGCATGVVPAQRSGADASGSRTTRGLTAADRRVQSIAERDRVLFNYRTAALALRNGDYDLAKEKLDDAIVRIGGIITNDAEAARARSLFTAESNKPFIGEPYERVMAYYYRGILYWRDGQPDNARACFRSGQVIDSDPGQQGYDADYVLLDYLDGLASAKLNTDGGDAFRRAQQRLGEQRALPPYVEDANVLVFAEFGYGPRKYAAGEYGQQLRFYIDDSPTHSARLVLEGGKLIVPLPGYDDLGHQATTRGNRVMDHILGNKAFFKSSTSVAGDVALAGAIIANDQARRRERQGKDGDDANYAAVGLGLLGMIGKVASAATQTQADTRQWDNLPQRLSFAAVKLPAGEHRGRLEFLDRTGTVLERRSQPVTLSVTPDGRDTVVFLSELKR